jgi:hypothetical protein
MSTIRLSKQEYVNFIQVCKQFHISYTTLFTKSIIKITAKTEDLNKIGF